MDLLILFEHYLIILNMPVGMLTVGQSGSVNPRDMASGFL